MHDDSDLRLIELKQLGEEKSELELARDGLVAEQVASGAKCSDLESELAALQAQASADRLALESSQLADAAAARDSLALQLASEQALLHEAITERNRCKKMTESVQTEMQKLVAQLGQKGGQQREGGAEIAKGRRLRANGADLSLFLCSLSSRSRAPSPRSSASARGPGTKEQISL